MTLKTSPLESARRTYRPRLPATLAEPPHRTRLVASKPASSAEAERIAPLFPETFGQEALSVERSSEDGPVRPLRVAVVLSGGQAPGGHNVIAGLFDAIHAAHPDSALLGVSDGPKGLIEDHLVVLDATTVDRFRNTGGFDLIGSGRDKVETDDQIEAVANTAARHRLDAIVVVGGDDSNTNAAVLAEAFRAKSLDTVVVGVPKTIDGDLRNTSIEMSFGFDTATRVYSELIGNIARDAASSRKYWHFVKLMGRSASHVTLECALVVRPNLAIIGEEIHARRRALREVVEEIADVVAQRAAAGKRYGVCLVPEGIVEFVPEFGALMSELNSILATRDRADASEVRSTLSDEGRRLFDTLPEDIRGQLLLDRDAHGNVQVSKIETEKLLSSMVRAELERRRRAGSYEGKFDVQHHFFGYEGRAAAPTNFDADYTYALGRVAAVLAHHRRTGYTCCVSGLVEPSESWRGGAVPVTSLLRLERRRGSDKPVIAKALVELDGKPFGRFAAGRAAWALDDAYVYPGAIQYYGPPELCDGRPSTLELERGSS